MPTPESQNAHIVVGNREPQLDHGFLNVSVLNFEDCADSASIDGAAAADVGVQIEMGNSSKLNEFQFGDDHLKHIFGAARRGQRNLLPQHLRALATGSGDRFPKVWLQHMADAITNSDWSRVGEDFISKRFIGPGGEFLLLGDYTVRRQARESTELTVVHGRTLASTPLKPIQEAAERLFDELRQPISEVVPVEVLAACGSAGSEGAEAFLVPDGWCFGTLSHAGPALNDMKEQRRRFDGAGVECIQRIFEQPTAALLLQAVQAIQLGDTVRALEYQLHDAGHGTGIGLSAKLSGDLLRTSFLRGVEEWRADGVAFSLSQGLYGLEMAAEVVASNLCTRFGIDAHRRGGINSDTDVDSSLLTFEFLTRSGQLTMGPTGRLTLIKNTQEGLLRAVEMQRVEAVALTHRELQLETPAGLWWLYSGVHIAPQTHLLFNDKVLKPCRGLYTELR